MPAATTDIATSHVRHLAALMPPGIAPLPAAASPSATAAVMPSARSGSRRFR
uniref:hypothetical protein n=1 Tax=Cohnella rhizosphaerae TaxID=1457232 RepID=UPI003B8A9798